MPKFRIEMELTTKNERILIADFDSSQQKNNTITFDENLTEDLNDQFNLSFSIPEKVENVNFNNLIKVGRPLWLHFSSPVKSVRMVITSYSHQVTGENKIYNVEAQDYASFVFAKNNAGLTLDTFADFDFLDWLEYRYGSEARPTVKIIADHILERGWLQKVDESPPGTFAQSGWTVIGKSSELDKPLNIEISDSNTYGGLIEIANSLNLNLRFDYNNETVEIYSQEDEDLDKNYTLSESFNVQDYSKTFDGDNLYSLFYVQGGEDELGLPVVLFDETDYRDNFLINIDYFKDAGIISQQDYNEFIGKFAFEGELFGINNDLSKVIERREHKIDIINNIWNTILSTSEVMYADTTNEKIFEERYEVFKRQFSFKEEIPEKYVTQKIFTKEFPGEWNQLLNYRVQTNDWISITYDGVEYLKNQNPGFTYYLEDPRPNVEVGEFFFFRIGLPNIPYYIELQDLPNFDPLKFTNVKSNNLQYFVETIKDTNTIKYPIIEELYDLDKDTAINQRRKTITDRIDQIEENWKENFQIEQCMLSIDNIESGQPADLIGSFSTNACSGISMPETVADANARLSAARESLEIYPSLIGDVNLQLDGSTVIFNKVPFSIGRFTNILEFFDKANTDFRNRPGFNLLEAEPSILDDQRRLTKQKLDFWYNLKKDRQHVFLEGYFEDDIETNPTDLKTKAEIIYANHQTPNEDFNVTYIDASEIVGVQLQDIQVGDFIQIQDKSGITDSRLKVSNISRVLKDSGNITVTIYRYNMVNELLEKLIASINTRQTARGE